MRKHQFVRFRFALFHYIVWILICALAISSCGRDSSARRDSAPPINPALQTGGPTLIFPLSFDGASKLEREGSGVVSLLQGKNLSNDLENYPHYQQLTESGLFGEMAVEFVYFFKIPFQLEDPKSELSVTRVQEDDLGYHQVRLAQNYRSVPVLNSELIVHFDRDDHVYLVQGQYIRTPAMMDLEPKMTLNAVINAIKDHGNLAPASTNSGPAILPMDDDPPKLVYRLRSQVALTDQSILLVDADSGVVLRKLPTIYHTQ